MTSKYEGFPEPDEIDGAWDWDKIHAPRPLTPLAGDAVVMAMGEGFTRAQHEFGSPLALKCRMVNYYFYATFTPDDGYAHSGDTDIARYIAELAAYVDQKMRAASDSAPATDMLGLAILVALNIADEYFRASQQQSSAHGELNERALRLEQLVDQALRA